MDWLHWHDYYDCSIPKGSSSNHATADLRKLSEPDAEPKSTQLSERQKALWNLTTDQNKEMETKISALRKWTPCSTLCKCYPAQAMQVYGLEIQCDAYERVSGFFSIRDYYDRRRIYIFNNQETNGCPISKLANGSCLINSHRGILYGDLVLEYELKLQTATPNGSTLTWQENLLQGEVLHKMSSENNNYFGRSQGGQYSYSSHKIIHTTMIIDRNIKMILKFVRFAQGIEAQIIIKPSTSEGGVDSIRMELTARMGDIADKIKLFHGKYSGQGMNFVLVVPFSDILELEFTGSSPSGERAQKKYTFNSFYHGHSKKSIFFGFRNDYNIDMEIKWSRM